MVQGAVQHLVVLVLPPLLVTAALLAWQPHLRGVRTAAACQHCNATRVAFFTAGERMAVTLPDLASTVLRQPRANAKQYHK